MKAALYARNKQFVLGTSPKEEPRPGDVRLKVAYCGICGTDMHIFHGKMDSRVNAPQSIGHEMSGVVDAVGAGVDGFAVGEKVVVCPLIYTTSAEEWGGRPGVHIRPGLKFMGIDTPGAFQGYWNVPFCTLYKVPDHIDMELAALCEPLAVACHSVRRAGLKAGENAVIIGGGPIGILVALVARKANATVWVSEINGARIKLMESLGINVINPRETDLKKTVMEQTGGIGADVVFEVTGSSAGAEIMTELPRVRGRIVVVGVFSAPVPVNLHPFFWKELELFGTRVYEPADFIQATGLLADGALPLRPLISRVVPLEEITKAFEEIGAGADIVKTLVKCF